MATVQVLHFDREARQLHLVGGQILPVTMIFADGEEVSFEELDGELYPQISIVAGPTDTGEWVTIEAVFRKRSH